MRKMMTLYRAGLQCSAFLALLATGAARGTEAAPGLPVRVETGVGAKMRDGVVLMAGVYRPAADGSFPALQAPRGGFASEGEFYPFRHEIADGYDSVEWAAAQPWSDGKVGMFGGSYVGATQMLAAGAKPPHLVAIFPYITASEYYEGWTS